MQPLLKNRPQFKPHPERASLDARIWLTLLLPWLLGFRGMLGIGRLR